MGTICFFLLYLVLERELKNFSFRVGVTGLRGYYSLGFWKSELVIIDGASCGKQISSWPEDRKRFIWRDLSWFVFSSIDLFNCLKCF